MEHWLPILQEVGLLTECPPDNFTVVVEWVPLYSPESLQKHLPVALSTFATAELPSLTAMLPPDDVHGYGLGVPPTWVPGEAVNHHWWKA